MRGRGFGVVLWGLTACGPLDPATRDVGSEALAWVQPVASDGVRDPRELHYVLDTDHRRIELELQRHSSLFGPDYVEVRIGADGEPLPHPRSAWANSLNCWFFGRATDVTSGESGFAALRTCDGEGMDRLSGRLSVGGAQWRIRPDDAVGAGHVLSTIEEDELEPGWCGTGHTEEGPGGWDEGADGASSSTTAERRTIALHVVNDRARRDLRGGATERGTADIVADMARRFWGGDFSPPLTVTLTGQTTYTSSAPWEGGLDRRTADGSNLIRRFRDWLDTPERPEADTVQLFTGRNLDGTTKGVAWLRTTCGSNPAVSSGIVETRGSLHLSSLVATHELGHNLGQDHDGTGNARSCGSSGTIMAASVPFFHADSPWSECSEQAISDRPLTCLEDEVGIGWPCGNGVLDAGETCDCGALDCTDRDLCCDGATCQLAAQATCAANDTCCELSECAPKAAGEVCREADGDRAAVACDGVSGRCPGDRPPPPFEDEGCDNGGCRGAIHLGPMLALLVMARRWV